MSISNGNYKLISNCLLFKFNNPPIIESILISTVINDFNMTRRSHMFYENVEEICKNITSIIVFKFPIMLQKIKRKMMFGEKQEYEEYHHQFSYGLFDDGYVFILKSQDLNDDDEFGKRFSRGYICLKDKILPIFNTPYISHISHILYPEIVKHGPKYYRVLKYLDNNILNPKTTEDNDKITKLLNGYEDMDINMRITLDGYCNNSIRYWNNNTKQHLWYCNLSVEEQRFIVLNYESDEDEYYEGDYSDYY